jgi:tRNA modification GTPase
VTNIAGTTRDSLEEFYEVAGFPLLITDTAGVKKPKDRAEEAGIKRAGDEINNADILLVVLDGTKHIGQKEQQLISKLKQQCGLVVVNKIDLKVKVKASQLKGRKIVWVSAKTREGIPRLEKELTRLINNNYRPTGKDSVYLGVRHREALERSLESLKRAYQGCLSGLTEEEIATDLKAAIIALGEISGETVSEEVINEIFSRFCVGK